MIRILQFEGGNPRHVHYRNLFAHALEGRGGKGPQEKVSNQDQRSESRLYAHLKSISMLDEAQLVIVNTWRADNKIPPLDAPDDPLLKDPRPQTLVPEGGTLRIAQEDFKLLEAYLKETVWQSHLTQIGVAFEDWFGGAEKVEDDAKDETKPALTAVGGSRRSRTTG